MRQRRLWFSLVVALMILPAAGAAIARAQTDQAASSELVSIGEFDFPVDATEPFEAHIVAVTAGQDGRFTIWYPAAQLADGTFVGLTPCDNVAVICAPIISPAKGAFTLADPSDTFHLADEKVTQ